MKEEKVYLLALDVLERSLEGNTVDPGAVATASSMMIMLWSSVHAERIKKEQIKQAMRETYPEFLNEKESNK